MPRIKVGPPRRDMGDGRLPRVSYHKWDKRFALALGIAVAGTISGVVGYHFLIKEKDVCRLGEYWKQVGVDPNEIFYSGLPEDTGVRMMVKGGYLVGGDKQGPFPEKEISSLPVSFEIKTPSGIETWQAQTNEEGIVEFEYSCKPYGKER